MPKLKRTRTEANSPKPSASEKPVADVVTLEVLEKLAQSIESNQRMLAELWNLRKQQELQKQDPELKSSVGGQQSQTERTDPEPLTSPDPDAARSIEKTQDSMSSTLFSIFEKKAAKLAENAEKRRLSLEPGKSMESQKGETPKKIQGSGCKLRDRADIGSHHGHKIPAAEPDDQHEISDGHCEIITTEIIRKLENVPKMARQAKDPEMIRGLLEDINLSHLPRKQTKFVVWYQTTIGGVFYKEAVESIHHTVKFVYFQLNSGTVLKFNRALGEKA